MTSHLKRLQLNRRVVVDQRHCFRKTGTRGTLEFKIDYYYRLQTNNEVSGYSNGIKMGSDGHQVVHHNWRRISPWHHIPLFQFHSPNGTLKSIEEDPTEKSLLLASLDELHHHHHHHDDSSCGGIYDEDDGIDEQALALWDKMMEADNDDSQSTDRNNHSREENGEEKDKESSTTNEETILLSSLEEGETAFLSSPSSASSLNVAGAFLSMSNILMNMVVEIPKLGKEKMEIATDREYNPIVQDTKKGEPRLCSAPMYWNYGALPRTWENPTLTGRGTKNVHIQLTLCIRFLIYKL